MKTRLVDLLICPACLPREDKLTCQIKEENGGDILSGALLCDQCGAKYPIQDGIASLLPGPSPNSRQDSLRYESPSLVSAYLWSHYADLSADMDASTAYKEWAELLGNMTGFSIDAGCAVGRFTFEMGRKSDFVVGIDNSHSFIANARQLMTDRKLLVSLPDEGLFMEDLPIELPETWSSNKVDFIVGDVQCLPFKSDSFSSLASLNLVDKVPSPLVHLKEMNRVARKNNAQFLFSDPFSWSTDIAVDTDWLGGTNNGLFKGRGIDNIMKLFTGERPELLPPWQIEREGHLWWKIRNHHNHFELIRSCFVKARR